MPGFVTLIRRKFDCPFVFGLVVLVACSEETIQRTCKIELVEVCDYRIVRTVLGIKKEEKEKICRLLFVFKLLVPNLQAQWN